LDLIETCEGDRAKRVWFDDKRKGKFNFMQEIFRNLIKKKVEIAF
jgi:hypothetical protein